MEPTYIHEDKRIAIKIFLTVFLISSFFFKPNLNFARFELLTKAITHYGTTSIERVIQTSGIQCIDSFKLGSHTYILATPGTSFIALASYLPYAVFLQSRFIHLLSLGPLLELKLSQFVMALSTVILFTALLIAIFFLGLRQIGCTQKKAIIFSFLLYFGTPVIFCSLNVSNGQNILEAALLFIAFFIINISKMQRRGLVFLSGLLCGLAVFMNVPSLSFLPFFIFIILLNKRWQNLIPWILGAFFGVLPLLIYNQISFGNLLRSFYNARYGNLISFHLRDSFNIAKILLISPMTSLVFFSPFFIMLILMFRKLWANLVNRFIFLCALLYIGCLCIVLPPTFAIDRISSTTWHLTQGGGGPRYLLPIIPFLLYTIASTRLDDLEWKKKLASVLIFVSVIINTPGLFWSGGQPVFFNNLLVFCKNGFHSYMIDLVRDMLIKKGFNTHGLSMFPLLTILGICIWWIWIGNQWVRRLL